MYLVHRREEFRANKSLQKHVSEAANIIPVLGAVLTGITGDGSADGINYTQNGEQKHLDVDGIFVAVGSVPNTAPLEGICELDGGYVRAGRGLRDLRARNLRRRGYPHDSAAGRLLPRAADGANAVTSAKST